VHFDHKLQNYDILPARLKPIVSKRDYF